MDLSKIKLIASEIDGIITEDLSAIDAMGNIIFKQYYMKDFEAINKIKKHFKFVFVSSDSNVSYYLSKKKNIPFFWNERGDKKQALLTAMRRYEVTPENVLYVGCSYSDVENMKMAEYSICPEDAVYDAKNAADIVVPLLGGTGVLCEVYDILTKDFSTI